MTKAKLSRFRVATHAATDCLIIGAICYLLLGMPGCIKRHSELTRDERAEIAASPARLTEAEEAELSAIQEAIKHANAVALGGSLSAPVALTIASAGGLATLLVRGVYGYMAAGRQAKMVRDQKELEQLKRARVKSEQAE